MFNEDNLRDFSNLTDEELRERLSSAAKMGNISEARLKAALSDTDKIRKVISKLSSRDVERMLRIIGKENAEKMAEKLKGNQ